ncbi:MAG: hypothetical protein E7665_07410 [Ruminococcaceae bacterium]|nr:hypothetical protein [Oscillospiraceae bacterium]
MIYDSNRATKELKKELFQAPTAEYRGTPFWAWNCDLEEKELLRQIDIFKEMGLGGFHIHCRAGMSSEYLSDSFMELVKSCTEHAKKNEMLSWLYDEDRWPSGFAGGLVTKDESLRQKYIVFSCDPDYKVRRNTRVIARFDVVLDEDKCLASYKKMNEGEKGEGRLWTVYAQIEPDNPRYNNQAYVDTLNRKAIERFIEITHEKYYDAVGEEFGKTVPAMFTDEPQFKKKGVLSFADSTHNVTLPWTDDLDKTYNEAYGTSLIDHLPELLWELPGGKVSLTRYRYHDHVAERFAEAFADTCGKWCDDHGILLTGHMMEEPSLLSQTAALGDCMRSYRSFGLPGIDMLCARFEFTTAKQCQSAVHQYGRPGMLSELYGVTGWDFDFRGHKLHGDWQAALGVTVRVHHLSWVSMKGTAKRDYPASMSYQSPWYKEYPYVEDHFARLNTALTRGKPLVKVAVVHPVESYWLHFGPNEQTALVRNNLEDNFRNVTEWLLKGNIDFDYISESLLPDLCAKGSAPLKVGEMEYDAVIVPECETLRSTTLERLEDFRNDGGKLIFMGGAPKYENAVPSVRGRKLYEISENIPFTKGALTSCLENNRVVEIRDASGAYTNDLIHQIRRDETGLWLFVSHCCEPYSKDAVRSQKIRIRVKGRFVPKIWDTVTGEIRNVSYVTEKDSTCIFSELYDYDSMLLFLEYSDEESSYTETAQTFGGKNIPLPMTVDYALSEDNVLLLDSARYALDGEELSSEREETLRIDAALRKRLGLPVPLAQPWVIERKPAEHTVTLEYTIYSDIEYTSPVLALEDADKAQIVFNGEKVEYKDAGYYTDKSIRRTVLPVLKKGENILLVTLPFGERTNCESMYLLGKFGVRVNGRRLTVTPLPEKLGFSDLTYQGLPFYGGVVSYKLPVKLEKASELVINIPHYAAAVNTVSVDGEKKAVIAYPPYSESIGMLTEGEHIVTLDSHISRRNCFGDVHNADEKYYWLGPAAWVTTGAMWTYEYRLRRTGIISSPILAIREK